MSYRSTAEITSFARAVLGPLAHEGEPIATRHGPPVEHFTFSSPGEAVAWVGDALKELALAEPDANVALVARFPQHADVYFDGLSRAEVQQVRRVARQDFSWMPGFDVTDLGQTRDSNSTRSSCSRASASAYPDEPAARHALYVGATRAAHQLWCVAGEALSSIVVEAKRSNVRDQDATPGAWHSLLAVPMTRGPVGMQHNAPYEYSMWDPVADVPTSHAYQVLGGCMSRGASSRTSRSRATCA